MLVSEIKPYPKNAKKHPKKQVEQVAKSIKEFGFNQPLVVDKQGVIIVGHGRLEAAKLLKLEEVPVITVDLTEEQANAYRLADNKLNESEWDMALVIEELKGLSSEMLELTGFDRDLILEAEDKDDEVPDVPKEPQSKLGDIYQLGPHRILCGDSTKVEDLAVLMNGAKADMVFTDPPYNVDYKGSGENTDQGIMNDNMSDEAFDTFLTEAFKRIAENTKRTAGCYIFHSHKTASDFEKALGATGFQIDTQLIWNKPSAGMGMNDYRTKHEPFFYAYMSKKDKNFYGDRTGTTVWKIPRDDEKAFKWFKKQQESLERGETTVWTMSRANVNEYVHPTQKPAELPAVAMTKSSKPDDIVLDTFLGSGTTLIAAEKTGRVCYGIELDPKYIDVIIERWCQYTNLRAIIKNGVEIIWEQKAEDQQ
jgi:DNA modification methylase